MSKNNRCKQNSCKKEKENVLISFVRYGSIQPQTIQIGDKYYQGSLDIWREVPYPW